MERKITAYVVQYSAYMYDDQILLSLLICLDKSMLCPCVIFLYRATGLGLLYKRFD